MKLLATIALFFALITTGFAQHHNGRGSAPRSSTPHVTAQHTPPGHAARTPRQDTNNKHYREARSHWNGARFDHDYFYHHFGVRHPFPMLYWYGTPFACNSIFYADSVPFVVTSCIDGFYATGTFYILDDDGYILVNPAYPDVAIGLRVAW
jgi:hypothetical protein